MRGSQAAIGVVVLILIGAVPLRADALSLGCGEPKPTATIYSHAGSGESFGWTPDCVTLVSSFGTPASTTWTNLDGLFHQPAAAGCIRQVTINAGASYTLENIRLLRGHVIMGWTACDENATQARTGTFLPFRTEGPKLPVIEHDVDGPGTTTIHYICAFHGPVMHGRLVLRGP